MRQIANEGNRISFDRHGATLIGEVIKVKEQSVVVSISSHDASILKIDTPSTIVSHNHYVILD